ncbi:hypothetical protein VDGL01_03155 [Verticillium dahliae]
MGIKSTRLFGPPCSEGPQSADTQERHDQCALDLAAMNSLTRTLLLMAAAGGSADIGGMLLDSGAEAAPRGPNHQEKRRSTASRERCTR